MPLASAALLLYGGSQVLEGELSLGDLMMFLVYLAMLLDPLAVLANSATAFQNNLAGLDRVLDLLAEPREMADRRGAIADPQAGRRRPRDARAASASAIPAASELVLRDIDLDVRPARRSPWSAAAAPARPRSCNLVARFYDPTAGAVELDGVDLRDDRRRELPPAAGHRRAGRVSVRRHRGREHRLRRPRRHAATQIEAGRPGRQRPRVHRRARPTATRPSSASAACGSAAASGSGWPSPGPCWPTRGS